MDIIGKLKIVLILPSQMLYMRIMMKIKLVPIGCKIRAFARWVNKRIHKKCSWENYKYNYPDIINYNKW